MASVELLGRVPHVKRGGNGVGRRREGGHHRVTNGLVDGAVASHRHIEKPFEVALDLHIGVEVADALI
jgi:hypothetical protein